MNWSEVKEGSKEIAYTHVKMQSPIGEFVITWKSWKLSPAYVVELNNEFIDVGYELEAAKKIAEQYLLSIHKALEEFIDSYKIMSTDSSKNNSYTLLCSCFPAVGKSHLYAYSELKILDSDSSKFDKTFSPQNYIQHIKANLGKVDILLISSHDIIRDALIKEGLEFTLVYPNIDLKHEYIERCKQRGSNETFIKLISDNWDEWITQLQNQEACKKIELSAGQYLSDVIGIM